MLRTHEENFQSPKNFVCGWRSFSSHSLDHEYFPLNVAGALNCQTVFKSRHDCAQNPAIHNNFNEEAKLYAFKAVYLSSLRSANTKYISLFIHIAPLDSMDLVSYGCGYSFVDVDYILGTNICTKLSLQMLVLCAWIREKDCWINIYICSFKHTPNQQ